MKKCVNTGCIHNEPTMVDGCTLFKDIEQCGNKVYVDECEGQLGEKTERSAATPEPVPVGNGEIVLFEVMQDLMSRAQTGKEKYGTYLKTNNGRDALMDAYQEALDLAMYLKQKIMEVQK